MLRTAQSNRNMSSEEEEGSKGPKDKEDQENGSDDEEEHESGSEGEEEAPDPENFALTPAIAVKGVINMKSSQGRNLYKAAIKPLDEEKYDCKPDGLYQFLHSLYNRAGEFGWSDETAGVLMIPTDTTDVIGSDLNYLVRDYGTISYDRIKEYEETYIGTPSRQCQDNFMLYNCLMNSISKEGKHKILVWQKQYQIETEPGCFVGSGNLLLKIIIRESHLDTNATTASI